MAILPGGPGLAGTRISPFWILSELKADGGGDGSFSYKWTCKAPVKLSPTTTSTTTNTQLFTGWLALSVDDHSITT